MMVQKLKSQSKITIPRQEAQNLRNFKRNDLASEALVIIKVETATKYSVDQLVDQPHNTIRLTKYIVLTEYIPENA